MDSVRSYIVCSTPRSGSTLLCDLLYSTGVAGRPEEYFEARAGTGVPPHPGDYLEGLQSRGTGISEDRTPPAAPPYSDLRGISYRDHLERTFRLGTTDNGVFGTKLMWSQIDDLRTLTSQLDGYSGLALPELLDRLFGAPRYVWMRRRDKLRQAISLWRAIQTREWSSADATPDSSAPGPIYDFEAIDHLVRSLQADDDSWAQHFAAAGSAPLTIYYEDDLERDQTATIERVLDHLGVARPAGWQPAPRLERQADGTNDEWQAAYHRDLSARLARA
jgi:trehalose 2-sulfotransferase